MSLRHKRYVATLDTGAAADWNDEHIHYFAVSKDISDSFITPALTTNWDLTINATGVVGVIVLQDHHTLAFLDGGAANNDWSCMRYERGGAANNITHLNDYPILTTAVWMEAYAAAGNVAEFGFQDNAVAPFTATQDGAYFRISGNTLLAVTGTGAAETTTDITPAGGIPEYGHYRIRFVSEGAVDKVYFYVDDMVNSAAVHTTNLPDSDLTMSFATQTLGGTRANMYVDAVALSLYRYQG